MSNSGQKMLFDKDRFSDMENKLGGPQAPF